MRDTIVVALAEGKKGLICDVVLVLVLGGVHKKAVCFPTYVSLEGKATSFHVQVSDRGRHFRSLMVCTMI